MYETPKYTGNLLKDQILLLLTSCGRASRSDVNCMHESDSYIANCISGLKSARYITSTTSRPPELLIGQKMMQLLEQEDPASYEHCLRITNNLHSGGTARHIDNSKRASRIVALMIAANIFVGPQKPSLPDILNGTEEKIKVPTRTFFLNKEIRYTDEQKKSRAYLSRSSGVIFSRGTTGLVYSASDINLRMMKRTELEATMRVSRHIQDLYDNPEQFACRDNIIVCDTDENAARLFVPQAKQESNRVTLGDAVWNKAITGAAFRYIPANNVGAEYLNYITSITRQELLMVAFTKEELIAAEKETTGDAVTKGLICYEYLSCNVTKLAYIKRTHPDLSKIGIVCWDGQQDFLHRFFDSKNLRLRVIKRDSLENIRPMRKEKQS